jgi:glucokinase
MYLAGDIGGTKVILALFSAEKGPHHTLFERRYRSVDYDSVVTIVREFLQESGASPEAASIGVAGPVSENRVAVTNLPWVVDGPELSQVMGGVPTRLLNDLESIASAIPALVPEDLALVKPGKARDRGPIAVVAPGTGLGEAFLFWDGQRYRPIPSEGGHTDFAPATPLELALLAYYQPIMGHVSYERVCSGIGIPNLYRFLRETGRYEEPDWLRQRLSDAQDRTPIIVTCARENEAPICRATLDLFLSILGSEAGNLVLQLLATGGVYLGGGIPPRILSELESPIFHHAFTDKGRFRRLLEGVPVSVIINPRAALFGAANDCLTAAAEGSLMAPGGI